MKSFMMTCAAAALAAASFVSVHAENIVTAQVPYPFVASGVKMPAGTYYIHEMQPSGVLILRASNGRSMMMMSRPGWGSGPNGSAQLTFRNVSGNMVLTDGHESVTVGKTR